MRIAMRATVLFFVASSQDPCSDQIEARTQLLRTELDEMKQSYEVQMAQIRSERDAIKAKLDETISLHDVDMKRAQEQILVNYNAYQKALQDYNDVKSQTDATSALNLQLDGLREETASLRTNLSTCEQSKSHFGQRAKAELERALSSKSDLQASLSSTNERLNMLESKLLTVDHVRLMTKHTVRVGRAVLLAMRAKINRLANADVVEIAGMQLNVWEEKLRPTHEKITIPIRKIFEDARMREILVSVSRWIKNTQHYLEWPMNAMIEGLAQADPGIRAIFPESFPDRVVTFTYLMILVQLVSVVIGVTLSVLSSPFRLLISSKKIHESTKPVDCSKPGRTGRRVGKAC